MTTKEDETIFNDNLILQTFQEVASNFLKESISIKGQFCSFMSQNRFRKVTACRILLIYSKGGWEFCITYKSSVGQYFQFPFFQYKKPQNECDIVLSTSFFKTLMLQKLFLSLTQIGNPVVSSCEKVVNPILSLSDLGRDIEIVSRQGLDLPSNTGIKIIFQSPNFANASQYIELPKLARKPIALLASTICIPPNLQCNMEDFSVYDK